MEIILKKYSKIQIEESGLFLAEVAEDGRGGRRGGFRGYGRRANIRREKKRCAAA